ncbi:hypothetical protein LTR37_001069 [Vermiconidia calcicola]|uniref:Uncharacterized protein n=1 Tax=Vermiconidia calcicola TaxID=1690605 RepID=A0ACC3NY96_9PEZI|nr:hypothetical protein LTR37_001069 [Vermiconidia calcicola]
MPEFNTPTEAVITYTDSDWRLQPVLARPPGDHELHIRILATGICHTDIVNVGGIYPRILGHEGAGRILRKGPNVSPDLDIGDPVLLSFAHCKECSMCVTGHPAHCMQQVPLTIAAEGLNFALAESEGEGEGLEKDAEGRRRVVKAGYFGHSSFSGVAVAREESVVGVKQWIRSEEELKVFAPLGCGIQTGACAVVNILKPTPDDSIAVFGLGGVGLSAVMAAKALNLKTIIAIDILPNRLDLATSLGATHSINSKSLSPSQLTNSIQSLTPFTAHPTSPTGPTGIIDTTGIPTLLQAALASVSRLGRVVQLANQGPGSSVSVALPEHMRDGVSLTGTVQGDADPVKSIPMLINWHREGKLPLEKLEKMYPVEDFERAREEMHGGGVIKPVLIWPQD